MRSSGRHSTRRSSSSLTSTPACAPSMSAIRTTRRMWRSSSPPLPQTPIIGAAHTKAIRTSADGWSRPTMSPRTTAGISTSSTAQTPGCTSFSSGRGEGNHRRKGLITGEHQVGAACVQALAQAVSLEGHKRHCQVANTRPSRWPKTQRWSLCCRRNFGDLTPRAKGGIASRTMLVGTEVMTAELEVVVDPAVGGEKALRMTR